MQPHLDGTGCQAVGCPLCRAQHQIALTGTDVLAVHHVDILKLACRQLCILVAGRKLAADRNMDDRVIFLGVIFKEIGVFHQIGRRRFGHFAACIHIGEHIRRADGDTVQIAFFPHQDVHGHQSDVPFAQKFFGQVAGAVRSDLDLHVASPFFINLLPARGPHTESFPSYFITNRSNL